MCHRHRGPERSVVNAKHPWVTSRSRLEDLEAVRDVAKDRVCRVRARRRYEGFVSELRSRWIEYDAADLDPVMDVRRPSDRKPSFMPRRGFGCRREITAIPTHRDGEPQKMLLEERRLSFALIESAGYAMKHVRFGNTCGEIADRFDQCGPRKVGRVGRRDPARQLSHDDLWDIADART